MNILFVGMKASLVMLVFLTGIEGTDKLSQSRQKIVSDTFKGRDLMKSTKKTKAIKPNSAFAEWILFITDKSTCKYVAKVFKDINEYDKEKESLDKEKEFSGFVNGIHLNCGKKLPVLMEYLGSEKMTIGEEEKGVVLLSRAKGISLADILKNISGIDNDIIIDIFKNIGEQLGELDSVFYKSDKKGILKHPDSHLGNFTYDRKDKQLYWIDTAGLEINQESPVLSRFNFVQELRDYVLYGYGTNFLAAEEHFGEEREPFVDMKEKLPHMSSDKAERFVNDAQKVLLAIKSLYEGFIVSLKENELPLEKIKKNYTKLFDEDYLEELEMLNEEIAKMGGGLKPIKIKKLNVL